MRILLFAFLLTSFTARSVTHTQEMMSPNRQYMQFFLETYLPWHKKHFESSFYKINLHGGEKFLRDNLARIDHWKTPDLKIHDQLLIGLRFKDKKPVFVYQMYLHPEGRTGKIIQNLKSKGEVLFIEWDNEGKVCFLVKKPKDSLPFRITYPDDATDFLVHYCKDNGKFNPEAVSFTTNIKTKWTTPFESTGPEVRTYSPSGLEQIFYRNMFTHIGFIPRKFYHYVNTHGEKIHLPFDKYSTDEDGNLTVYYP